MGKAQQENGGKNTFSFIVANRLSIEENKILAITQAYAKSRLAIDPDWIISEDKLSAQKKAGKYAKEFKKSFEGLRDNKPLVDQNLLNEAHKKALKNLRIKSIFGKPYLNQPPVGAPINLSKCQMTLFNDINTAPTKEEETEKRALDRLGLDRPNFYENKLAGYS